MIQCLTTHRRNYKLRLIGRITHGPYLTSILTHKIVKWLNQFRTLDRTSEFACDEGSNNIQTGYVNIYKKYFNFIGILLFDYPLAIILFLCCLTRFLKIIVLLNFCNSLNNNIILYIYVLILKFFEQYTEGYSYSETFIEIINYSCSNPFIFFYDAESTLPIW